MAIETSKHGVATLSRMKFSGYVRYVTTLFNVHYCALFSSRLRVSVRVRIRFSVWLVSGCTNVFVLQFSIVIVTLAHCQSGTAL